MDCKHILLNRNSPGEDTNFERRDRFMLMGWPFFTKDIGLNDKRKLGMKVEKGKRLEVGEHVCRERHWGTCVFEEGDGTTWRRRREGVWWICVTVFALKGESVFLIGFWFWAKGNFRVLGFWLFFFFWLKFLGVFFLFNNAGF